MLPVMTHEVRTAMNPQLFFVTCASDPTVLSQHLLSSPCLADGRYSIAIHTGARSAAEAFNTEMNRCPSAEWLVWVHQDVYLPRGWEQRFLAAIEEAEAELGRLAVAGVYGISRRESSTRETGEAGGHAIRAGHILDRGDLLREQHSLPCLVDSLDECLFAVRSDTCLLLDPMLAFDFYATDLVLAARERGLRAAVVDAYCEHWSTTPRSSIPEALANRIRSSGTYFERKWAARLPLDTPCFSITAAGDVARQCRALCAAEHP